MCEIERHTYPCCRIIREIITKNPSFCQSDQRHTRCVEEFILWAGVIEHHEQGVCPACKGGPATTWIDTYEPATYLSPPTRSMGLDNYTGFLSERRGGGQSWPGAAATSTSTPSAPPLRRSGRLASKGMMSPPMAFEPYPQGRLRVGRSHRQIMQDNARALSEQRPAQANTTADSNSLSDPFPNAHANECLESQHRVSDEMQGMMRAPLGSSSMRFLNGQREFVHAADTELFPSAFSNSSVHRNDYAPCVGQMSYPTNNDNGPVEDPTQPGDGWDQEALDFLDRELANLDYANMELVDLAAQPLQTMEEEGIEHAQPSIEPEGSVTPRPSPAELPAFSFVPGSMLAMPSIDMNGRLTGT